MQKKKKKFSMIDLFAGCGGLSLGLEQADFETYFVNELNTDAMATYLANRSHKINGEEFRLLKKLHVNDINDLLKKNRLKQMKEDLRDCGLETGENGDLDLLVGGPPCQGYSGIGIRRSYSVDKKDIPSNQLYQKMATLIDELRPKIFLFENVRGILTSRWTAEGQKGDIWRDVYTEYSKLGARAGYAVRWSLIQACNYGVPQNRPRVLMVGIRNDVLKHYGAADQNPVVLEQEMTSGTAVKAGFLPSTGICKVPDLEDLLSDLVDDQVSKALRSQKFPDQFETTAYPREATTDAQMRLRGSSLKKGDAVTEQEYSRHSPEVVEKFRAMLASDGKIPARFQTKKFSQRLLPPRWGNGKPTITATSLPDDYVHFSQPRTLTVREWARLQTFPDWYEFRGKRTTGGLRRAGNPREGIFDREVPKYTQIGNAVPVWLAQALGEHFAKILTKARK
jgi:DNA (cytosine-5)-methyltransferase 1